MPRNITLAALLVGLAGGCGTLQTVAQHPVTIVGFDVASCAREALSAGGTDEQIALRVSMCAHQAVAAALAVATTEPPVHEAPAHQPEPETPPAETDDVQASH